MVEGKYVVMKVSKTRHFEAFPIVKHFDFLYNKIILL